MAAGVRTGPWPSAEPHETAPGKRKPRNRQCDYDEPANIKRSGHPSSQSRGATTAEATFANVRIRTFVSA